MGLSVPPEEASYYDTAEIADTLRYVTSSIFLT